MGRAYDGFAYPIWLCKFLVKICGSSLKFLCLCKLPSSCKLWQMLMVDYWRFDNRRICIVFILKCAHPKLHLPYFFFLTWYMGRIFNSCDFSHFLVHYQRKGVASVNLRHSYKWYKLQFKELACSEVVGHKPCSQCLWSRTCSHLLIPMLVHNSLDLVIVLRVVHTQKSDLYLKVFIS